MISAIRNDRVFIGIFILIFFFNRLMLPSNLQMSILLFPFFGYFLLQVKQFHNTLKIISLILLFGLFSISKNMVFVDYIKSSMVMACIVIFFHSFYVKMKGMSSLDRVIKVLTLINLFLVLLALISLFIPFLKPHFWYLIPFTSGYEAIPRLKLFELEASHYSLGLLPLFMYYFWRVLNKINWRDILLLFSLGLSLILSFSLGVLGVLTISIVIVLLGNFFNFVVKKNSRRILFSIVLLLLFALIVLYIKFPENPLFFRINNVFNGEDTSGRGRTYEAFDIALVTLMEQSKQWFGIGLGQFKYFGREALINYYNYPMEPGVIRLPNCMAETLVSYGYLGLGLKILLQCFLFVRFKVYQNVYRLSVFMSIFIYQFTGSFLFNTTEYILWVLCIVPTFSSFSSKEYFRR